jgi:hypothetical protein
MSSQAARSQFRRVLSCRVKAGVVMTLPLGGR